MQKNNIEMYEVILFGLVIFLSVGVLINLSKN